MAAQMAVRLVDSKVGPKAAHWVGSMADSMARRSVVSRDMPMVESMDVCWAVM